MHCSVCVDKDGGESAKSEQWNSAVFGQNSFRKWSAKESRVNKYGESGTKCLITRCRCYGDQETCVSITVSCDAHQSREVFSLRFLPAGPIGSRPEVSTASVSFHPHCGTLVTLSNNNHMAERKRPSEEFKNAIVLSSAPLRNDELFEVQLESMTEMWAGSLEVGVTSHDPATIVLPPTMTSMATDTWMLSGTSMIINGQETTKNYSEISLETIQIEDRVGIMRRSNGCLHFFINGEDQGVAVTGLPEVVYGVVDLYGAAVQVSLYRDDEPVCVPITNRLENSENQEISSSGEQIISSKNNQK